MRGWFRPLATLLVVLSILALALLVPSGAALAEGLAPLPIDSSPGPKPDPKAYLADQAGYEDESITVQVYKDRAQDTNVLVARVQIKDASQLRTAPSDTWRHVGNKQAATIARRYNAVAAINGDFFQFSAERYIVRQGELIRNRPTGEDLLLIDDQGDFHILQGAKRPQIQDFSEQLQGQGREVVNAFSFGPALVLNGQAIFPEKTNYFNTAALKQTQRSIICQLGPLDYMIVSTEGPEDPGSVGFRLAEAAQYCVQAARSFFDKDCLVAYNLDGGSSNSLVLSNEKINSPQNPKKRAVSDIIYFATLVR